MNSGGLDIRVELEEQRLFRRVGSAYVNAAAVEETIKQMKTEMDHLFYGDARCALRGLRLLASNIAEYSTDRVAFRDAINTVEEKLQLRTDLDLTQL